jgi:mono/diheme cytochrome c family protein
MNGLLKCNLAVHGAALFLVSGGSAAASDIDYIRDVKPIFAKSCVRCHGAETSEVDLRLDFATALLKGGNSGAAVVPGQSDKSLLITKITTHDRSEAMPPEGEGELLNSDQIAIIRKWIDNGAIAPKDEVSEETAKRSDHWSFQPITHPAVPQVHRTGFQVRSAIDAFILAKLKSEGLAPSSEANRTTLIRRLSLDLVGLPPTPEETRKFVEDSRSDAYERLVDRLLESPQYGERWGRHWLDLARYADSNGYTFDNPRVIWPYRDWVIGALNADMPFDQFVIEQMAGDMLPDATQSQRVATGFHRNTQINEEGGTDAEEFRIEAVIDRVSTTGSVFLGLTVGCARCHNHKFDPISQREFYQMFALLNNADEPKLTVDDPGDKKITTLVMDEHEKPRTTRIMLRGEYPPKGAVVHASLPAVLPKFPAGVTTPNRLDFARWIVSAENPLTPRVTVNRIWQHYFGRGLVETENDFGTQGSLPTHPELLDWLASEFVRQGWSMKAMHRLIVCSATYRQTSVQRPDLQERDPNNKLLARQKRLRLEAEAIRDSALAASGLLSKKIGGPSVFPPQPTTSAKLTQREKKWQVSEGEDRYRRGMYTYLWRLSPHPQLRIFDSPEATTSCTRRDRSNTPLQALVLLNDEAMFEAAEALALRLLQDEALTDNARIQRAFELCLARAPVADEVEAMQELLVSERADEKGARRLWKTPALDRKPAELPIEEVAAWTMLARSLLNCDEFITRE